MNNPLSSSRRNVHERGQIVGADPRDSSGIFRGFSLVEVVMALGICSFVLISVMGLLVVAQKSAKDAIELTQAGKIVQAVGSQLLQSSFTNLRSLTTNPQWSFDYEGNDRSQTNALVGTEYFKTVATPSVGILLPGAAATNTNILRFQVVTAMSGRTITNSISVPNAGY